ncbi:hypothetical protein CDG76_23155 [Nostoc sp. 'Peltigera membranacea cyanobiont' 210A]|nr:hypothetical protein CDG76_23155 [Nostoc sp. 'Peltigera membranacea cyanobiont' 210A]
MWQFMSKQQRALIRNKHYLMIKLPEFYEKHLKQELGLAEYLILKILINLLQSIKTVSIEALTTALPQQYYLKVEEIKFNGFDL